MRRTAESVGWKKLAEKPETKDPTKGSAKTSKGIPLLTEPVGIPNLSPWNAIMEEIENENCFSGSGGRGA
jgi:hypothetical protein